MRRIYSVALTVLAIGGVGLVASPSIALAQTCTAGLVDKAFGSSGTGYVQMSPMLYNAANYAPGEGIVIEANGELLVLSEAAIDASGNSIPDLVKLKKTGVRDLAFGGIGSIVPEQPAPGAGDAQFDIDTAGNLLVALITDDNSSILVHRYLPTGVPDATYGVSGIATIPLYPVVGPWALRVAADGSVFIANRGLPPPPAAQNFVPVVVKLTPAGALDATFGQGGYSFFYTGFSGPLGKATDLALNADGTILVGGRVGDNQTYNRFYVARLLANGTLDPTFGTHAGMTVVDFGTVLADGRRLAVQPNGKILQVGGILLKATDVNPADGGAVRLNQNGTLDKTFNSTGVLRMTGAGGAYGVAVQNNEKILITSAPYIDPAKTLIEARVIRLTPTGQSDTTFGKAGTGAVFLPVAGYAQSQALPISYDELTGTILVGVAGADATNTLGVSTLVQLDSGTGVGCH